MNYQKGQIWSYKTRQNEEKSRVYIVKIDQFNGQKIYHLYIDNLQLKNNLLTDGIQDVLPHIPVSEKTLDESLVALQGEHRKTPIFRKVTLFGGKPLIIKKLDFLPFLSKKFLII